MEPVKLVGRAASTAIHAVRHPIASVSYAAGLARGVVGVVVHGVTVRGHDSAAGQQTRVPEQSRGERSEATTPPPRPTPQRVAKPVPDPADLPEPVVIEATDEEPGEAFATEPKAVSRESAHGGPAATDAEIDAWIDAAVTGGDEVDIETPVGTTGADVGHNPDTAEADLQQPGTEPLLDPGTAKAIRSEAETLRKAAESNPD